MAVLLAGLIVLSTACAREVSTGADEPSRSGVVAPTPGSTTQELVDAAYVRMARGNGDASAVPEWEVRTTLGAAELHLSGNTAAAQASNAATPVVVVEGSGTFSGAMEKVPAGAGPDAGGYLLVVVRASDGSVMAWGLRDEKLPLSELGPLITPRS